MSCGRQSSVLELKLHGRDSRRSAARPPLQLGREATGMGSRYGLPRAGRYAAAPSSASEGLDARHRRTANGGSLDTRQHGSGVSALRRSGNRGYLYRRRTDHHGGDRGLATFGVTTGPWQDEPIQAAAETARAAAGDFASQQTILSSWLSRAAAIYRARPETLLEQVGVIEIAPAILDRHATPADVERLAVAMRSSPQAIRRMSFTGQPREALEFVSHRAPLWTCPRCAREFAGRGPVPIKLRQWFVAVAAWCRRCGGRLIPARTFTARAIDAIIAAGGAVRTACPRLREARACVRRCAPDRCRHPGYESPRRTPARQKADALSGAQSWAPALLPRPDATAPMATCGDEATSPPRT